MRAAGILLRYFDKLSMSWSGDMDHSKSPLMLSLSKHMHYASPAA